MHKDQKIIYSFVLGYPLFISFLKKMKTQQQEAGRGNGSKKAKKRLDKIDSALRLNKDRREPLLQLSKVLHQITPLLSLPQKLSNCV